jgi:two-component system phosphate regulon sensor histidine kinase PhoR
VLPSGRVVGDSDEDPAVMKNHSDRPEVVGALQQGFGWSVRLSSTLGKNMMYVAIPIKQQEQTAAIVRTAISVTDIDQVLTDLYTKIVWGGLAVAVCAAAVSLLISRRISRPIVNMEQIAQGFAQGRLDLRVPIPRSMELSGLAKALNEMATQLRDRILTITEQKDELEAVLSSMIEGVIALDAQGRIMSINRAAAQLLDIGPQQTQGRNVEEVIRNVDLQQFVRRTIDSPQPTEGDITLPAPLLSYESKKDGRSFQLHGTSLSDTNGRRRGAVIVLNDMTRIRSLEDLRREFVANVSHELRTPVTSIQGFVEALLEGRMKEPHQVERYLKIIAKHSDRLNAIIEDLLTLSRLEEDDERRKVSFEKTHLKPVLQTAIELLNIKAADKHIAIELVCEQDIQANINAALLEQAILNLLDNAIKYSEPAGNISVVVHKRDKEIAISVQDKGCGIPKEHLLRIFERFYVVDKSRSRKLGGTGLGLSIVKHIAQAHGGSVSVDSTLGVGSTFTIHLPVD